MAKRKRKVTAADARKLVDKDATRAARKVADAVAASEIGFSEEPA